MSKPKTGRPPEINDPVRTTILLARKDYEFLKADPAGLSKRIRLLVEEYRRKECRKKR